MCPDVANLFNMSYFCCHNYLSATFYEAQDLKDPLIVTFEIYQVIKVIKKLNGIR